MHGVRIVQHALAACVAKYTAQEVFDMTKCCAAQILAASNGFHHLLAFQGSDVAQCNSATRLHVAQPNVPVAAIGGPPFLVGHIRQIRDLDELVEAHRAFRSNHTVVERPNNFLSQLFGGALSSVLARCLCESAALLDAFDRTAFQLHILAVTDIPNRTFLENIPCLVVAGSCHVPPFKEPVPHACCSPSLYAAQSSLQVQGYPRENGRIFLDSRGGEDLPIWRELGRESRKVER